MPIDPRRKPGEPPRLSAEKARGGEIILRTPARRWIFIGGLVALIVIAVVGYWLR